MNKLKKAVVVVAALVWFVLSYLVLQGSIVGAWDRLYDTPIMDLMALLYVALLIIVLAGTLSIKSE